MSGERIGDAAVVVALLWFVVVGGAASVIDVRTHRLPSKLLLTLSAGVVLPLVAAALAASEPGGLLRSATAGAALFTGYFLVAWIAVGELGFGDVKLAAIVGLLTGWFGWDRVVLATVMTFVLAGLTAAVLVATRRATVQDRLAFGPFMVIGAVLAVIEPILNTP
ncbi:prepilin peptidase [Actinotalea ferrariae]|uniref:prepilin peptidase n=1 Tax=Actinotalea ferrariae TaxID=1386098 RepID=UPI001C8CC5F0|nr:A24 family peptidase [Actinotalea ferrariae]MBX9245833.1 prepilin peptidase [Actinotalea ferrariae]